MSPPRRGKINDLDLTRWREYGDLITDSLWLLGKRGRGGEHVGDYWGNFVPQIPNQVLRRFTRAGDWVVDLFSGMGTTLIECDRLGRRGVGVELSPEVAERSRARTKQPVLVGDSADPTTVERVRELTGCDTACVFLHPPYHDVIKFSDDPRDLSNASDFIAAFRPVVANATALLRPGGHLALVIGDVYRDGEVVPLGFECIQACRDAGLQLRAINVKNIQGNVRGKGQATNLWRYRALKQGLYVFKHEYVVLFRKPG